MGTKVKETCTVLNQECIGKDIYSMWIQTKTIAGNARPGQFVSVYTQDGSKLLPRPISLCEIDKEKGALRLVYRVTGPKTGTESFSRLHAGAQLELLGPLGNGFPLEEAAPSAAKRNPLLFAVRYHSVSCREPAASGGVSSGGFASPYTVFPPHRQAFLRSCSTYLSK